MTTLRRGARGPEVRELQQLLINWGYNPGPVDGIFGIRTEQAVRLFQRDRGLAADGLVGPQTWPALLFQQPGGRLYTIQASDTFYKLAQRFKVSLENLLAANAGVNPNNLRIGQVIGIPAPGPGLTRTVSSWIPYWVQTQAFQALQNQAELFSSISPFWYQLSESGDLLAFSGAEDSSLLALAAAHGIKVIPLISNEFNSQLASSVLNNPLIRQRHIQNILNKVSQMNYAGIEIDYENLLVSDREIFVVFLQELKRALAGLNKLLVVTIHAKTEPTGGWSGAEAHDYVGIGQNTDLVRIMGYDYHWRGGPPGSIAPAAWIDSVLAYAVSAIPRNKLELGVPAYGYDWPQDQQAAGVTYDEAIATANRYKASIITNAQLGPHFTYTANGVVHEVWFVDALSFSTLLDLVNKYEIQGICIWYLSAEDPEIYTAIRNKF
ncbi:MAG: glycosyl hydrolase family 18 protein [Desulfitobacteriaceae bacterium]|nr:glycosyl hydrolase family 18 protein [Desulfitobacteriaceae bacterium]